MYGGHGGYGASLYVRRRTWHRCYYFYPTLATPESLTMGCLRKSTKCGGQIGPIRLCKADRIRFLAFVQTRRTALTSNRRVKLNVDAVHLSTSTLQYCERRTRRRFPTPVYLVTHRRTVVANGISARDSAYSMAPHRFIFDTHSICLSRDRG